MADKPKTPTTKSPARKPASGVPAVVLTAVDEVMTASQDPAASVPKKARQRIRKLGRQLDSARAIEAKRLRQSAKAQQQAQKRERQAADAAAQMATIIGQIRDEAGDAAAHAAPNAKVRQAAMPAQATKPAASAKPSRTAKGTPAAKPAATAKAVRQPRKPKPGA